MKQQIVPRLSCEAPHPLASAFKLNSNTVDHLYALIKKDRTL